MMIGRGGLHVPNLTLVIKYQAEPMAWHQVMQILFKYIKLKKQGDTGQYHAARIKQ